MNKLRFPTCFLCSITVFSVLFLSGCSENNINQLALLTNFEAQKINNLIDLNNDKKSDLIFWNTSGMSKPGKFLEPCFFETITVKGKQHTAFKLGEAGDIPVTGYFDDDSVIDYGVYRGYNYGDSDWFVKSGGSNNTYSSKFGNSNDIPVPGDYDGDEKTDLAVYRLKDSTFRVIFSTNQQPYEFRIGINGDIPVPKDYDGDGRSDFATYRQRGGVWTIKTSRNGATVEKILGGPNYLPFPADYDGDGKADLLTYKFQDNTVKAYLSGLSREIPSAISLKIKNQLKNTDFFPIPSDYDGDGLSELAFWSDSMKILVCFNLNQDLKKTVYRYSGISNSIPVSNFILRKMFPAAFIKKMDHSAFKKDKQDTVPFVSDFDSDYIHDVCLWSKNTGTFLCNSSRAGIKFGLHIGEENDVPVIGNFNGDSFTDIGVYRTSSMTFYYRLLGKHSPEEIQFVRMGDEADNSFVPKISDYDGDKKDDFAVYNSYENKYIIKKSSDSSG